MSICSRDQDNLDLSQEVSGEEMDIQEPSLPPEYPSTGHKRVHDGEGWETVKRTTKKKKKKLEHQTTTVNASRKAKPPSWWKWERNSGKLVNRPKRQVGGNTRKGTTARCLFLATEGTRNSRTLPLSKNLLA